ncbi:cell division protein FtsZ, partial [Chloroflexota bacterium]
MALTEVNEAAGVIREVADPSAQIIFGLATDAGLGSSVKLTLIATGFREGDADTEGQSSEPPVDDLPSYEMEDRRRSLFPWIK